MPDTKIIMPLTKLAKELLHLSIDAIDNIDRRKRSDFNNDHFQDFIQYLIGLFATLTGYLDAAIILTKNGHGFSTVSLLKSQMEALLIFLYFIEPYDNFYEINRRVAIFNDWQILKSRNNLRYVKNCKLLNELWDVSNYEKMVENDYKIVCDLYEDKSEFTNLKNSREFLKEKNKIAARHGIANIYELIETQFAGSIYVGDLDYDVRFDSEKDTAFLDFSIKQNGAILPLILVMQLQEKLIREWSEFIGIEDIIIPKLEKIFSINKL